MKTEEEIRRQKEHELSFVKDYTEVIPKTNEVNIIRNLMDQIELHNSRAELLDWVLEEGDFKKDGP